MTFFGLFSSAPSPTVAVSPDDCPDAPSKMTLTHVRYSTEHGFVSAFDALNSMFPDMSDQSIQLAISRLPRVAVIKAYWPPSTAKDQIKKSEFEGVSMTNLYLLTDETMGHKEELVEKINSFYSDVQQQQLNMRTHSFTERTCDWPSILLADDAKKTPSQLRYERDLRDRTINSKKYYEAKRRRDKAFRQKRKTTCDMPAEPVQYCSECNAVSGQPHWIWCNANPYSPNKLVMI